MPVISGGWTNLNLSLFFRVPAQALLGVFSRPAFCINPAPRTPSRCFGPIESPVLEAPVYTADRSWKNLKVGVRIYIVH
jgi:hypothetical protein